MKNNIVIFEFQDTRYASRARKEAFSLSKNNFIVTLIGFNREIDKTQHREENGVSIHEYPILYKDNSDFFHKSINIFMFNTKLFLFLMTNKFDILHLHDLKLLTPAILSKLLHKSILIYDAHELHIVKRSGNSLKNKLLSKLDCIKERIIIKFAEVIIQASDQRATFFSKYYKVKKPLTLNNYENISIIRNDVLDIRSHINKLKDKRIIIFTGNISIGGNQRIDNVIKALKYMDMDIHFCLLGRGTDKTINSLQQISIDIGVQDRFHILKPVLSEEVVSVLSTCDVAVIPIFANSLNSEYSALNKLSQSLMAGLPIACSSYDNLIEFIDNNPIGPIGKTFDVSNPKSIAKAINYILSNNLSILRINARKLAENYINWEIEERKLIKLYKSILW